MKTKTIYAIILSTLLLLTIVIATTINEYGIVGADGNYTTVNADIVNTGQGDNELYAMNQDVQTTDGVEFNSVTSGNISNILYVQAGNASDIQAKIDMCPSTGCKVVIPSGTYTISTTILVPSKVVLSGVGKTTIINTNIGYSDNIINGNGRVYDIQIENMKIVGTNQTSGDCININGYYNIINNIETLNCARYGIAFNTTSESSTNIIKGGKFNANESGIYISTDNNDMHIVDVLSYGGNYNMIMNGGGAIVNNIVLYGANISAYLTNVGHIIDNIRISSSPIAITINGTEQNIYNIWDGLNINSLTVSDISNTTLYVTSDSPYITRFSISSLLGIGNLTDIYITGNGNVDMKVNKRSGNLNYYKADDVTLTYGRFDSSNLPMFISTDSDTIARLTLNSSRAGTTSSDIILRNYDDYRATGIYYDTDEAGQGQVWYSGKQFATDSYSIGFYGDNLEDVSSANDPSRVLNTLLTLNRSGNLNVTNSITTDTLTADNIVIGDGSVQKNITLTSPDGSESCCGVDNSDTFSCSAGACS